MHYVNLSYRILCVDRTLASNVSTASTSIVLSDFTIMSTYIHTGSIRSRSRRQVSPLELFHGTTVLWSMFHFVADVCRHGDGHVATPILLRHGQEEWPDCLAAGQPVEVWPDDTQHTHNTCKGTGSRQGGIQWQCSQSTGKCWVKKHQPLLSTLFWGCHQTTMLLSPPPPQLMTLLALLAMWFFSWGNVDF